MKNKKLFIHALLENQAIKRKISFFVPQSTISLMLKLNRKPIAKTAKKMVEVLRCYEEYKDISPVELEKRLYEPAQ